MNKISVTNYNVEPQKLLIPNANVKFTERNKNAMNVEYEPLACGDQIQNNNGMINKLKYSLKRLFNYKKK